MKDNKEEAKAVYRLRVILPIISSDSNSNLIKRISLEEGVSIRTLKRWIKRYEEEGFEGLKIRKQNSNKKLVISEDIVEKAIILRRENPSRSVKDIIRVLELENECKKGEIKRSTLTKRLSDKGYSKKQMSYYTSDKDISARRFEKLHRMDLVQADFKYGPYLPIGKDNKMIQTYLHVFIDDATRYVLDAKFYTRQTVNEVEDSLKRVLINYGKPKRILLDNGKPYISNQFKKTCVKLGIIKSHAKPYKSWVKGKVERFNRLVDKFISEAQIEKYSSIEKLNENLKIWIDQYYHNRVDTTVCKLGNINETFKNDPKPLIILDKEIIDNAFVIRETRKVSKVCTISIEGETYEIDNLNLIGFEVEVIYDPNKLKEEGALVRRIGYEDSKAYIQHIGVNTDFNKTRDYLNTRTPIKVEESRVLKVLRETYKKKYPEYNKSLAEPKKELVPLYSNLNDLEEEKRK